MKITKKIITLLSLVCLLVVFSLFKFNFSLGMNHLNFSTSGVLFPLFGAFLSALDLVFVKWLSLVFLFVLKGGAKSSLLMFGIPSFLGALTFKYSIKGDRKFLDLVLRVVLPLLSILIFTIMAPGNSYLYSFYWFIPVGLFIFGSKKSNVLFSALSSTFVMHAVGSMIWLFIVPMSSQAWLSLIPVVALERFIMSFFMSAIYISVKKCIELIKSQIALVLK